MITIDVIVLLEASGLIDQERMEKHLKKEGFNKADGEEFVYVGNSTTTTMATKAYILNVFKKALQKSGFTDARLIFLLNEIAYPPYIYDKNTDDFEISEVKK